MREITDKEVRDLASRAVRLSVEDGKLTGFENHEKTILDNMDFLYYMVFLAKLDEREACAKVCEEAADDEMYLGQHYAAAIRARGQA